MPAVAEPRGLKRICMGCGTRFYDLNKRPIICPSCKAEFTVDVKAKSRRSKAIANDDDGATKVVEAAGKEIEVVEAVEGEEDVVSLEDVDEDDDDADDEDSIEIDDDIGDLEDLDEDDEEEAAGEEEKK